MTNHVMTVKIEGMGGTIVVPVMVGPKLANGGFWGWQR